MEEARRARLYRAWALLSSALCVALLGYIVAVRMVTPQEDDGAASEAERAPQATEPGSIAPARSAIDPLPAALAGLPREWISADTGADLAGHAVWLDLATGRDLVVEHCRHRGYFDETRGEPIPDNWTFCESVLTGAVLGLDEGVLRVRAASRALALTITRSGTEAAPRLALVIDGNQLDLVPGTKNDLFQRLEADPVIHAQKDRRWQALQPRALQAAGGQADPGPRHPETPIPR